MNTSVFIHEKAIVEPGAQFGWQSKIRLQMHDGC